MDRYKFIDIAKRITSDIQTRYQLGGWGQQDNDVYLFDCVCLIKSILWGFDFKKGGHGGAIYLTNGVPDVGANRMIELCTNISYDFKDIEIGEILWLDGHVGIYIGDRMVVEATAAWENKVLISWVEEDGKRIRNNHQVYKWVKHGKLPYIEYSPAYAEIIILDVIDITSRSVKVVYKTDIDVDETLYSLDGINYSLLPNDNIIDNLIPNMEYTLYLKVKRTYTNNYTEKSILFKTEDEPILLKYSIGNIVILNGPVYINPISNNKVIEEKNYEGLITNIYNHYGSMHPYQINELGWVDEKDIKLIEKHNILNEIIGIIKNIILLPFRIIKCIIKSIL